MKKNIIILLLIIALICALFFIKNKEVSLGGEVTLYSTININNIKKIKDEFEKEYPGIKFNYYSGTIKRMEKKLDVENSTAQINADVIWGGEVADLDRFKSKGFIEDSYDMLLDMPIAIGKNSKNKENAKLLYDFLMSKKGKAVLNALTW